MRSFLLFCVLIFQVPFALAWQGVVDQVVDGDSLKIRHESGRVYNVQLYGVRTPQLSQPSGLEAKEAGQKTGRGQIGQRSGHQCQSEWLDRRGYRDQRPVQSSGISRRFRYGMGLRWPLRPENVYPMERDGTTGENSRSAVCGKMPIRSLRGNGVPVARKRLSPKRKPL